MTNFERTASDENVVGGAGGTSGNTASAFRFDTAPAVTACRRIGRCLSSRASRTHENISLGEIPSRSRA